MERRVEPRFAVASHITLVPLSNPELEIGCKICEISAGGMRVQTSHAIPVGDRVLLDSEHHLVLAEVRNVEQSGNGFLIGVQRVGSASKLDCLADDTRSEQIRILTADAAATEPALASQTDSEPPEAALFPALPTPAVPGPAGPLQVDPLTVVPAPVIPQSVAEPPATELLSESSPHVPAKLLPRGPLSPAGRPIEMPAELTQPETPPEQPAPPKRFPIWYAVAAALVVAVASTAVFFPWQSPAKTAVTHVTEGPPAPVPTPVPPTPPAKPSFRVSARDSAWLAVSIDGKPVFARMLAKGETQDFRFSNFAHVHVGNAKRVDVSASSGSVPPISEGNPLRLLELTQAGVTELPWRNMDPPPPVLAPAH